MFTRTLELQVSSYAFPSCLVLGGKFTLKPDWWTLFTREKLKECTGENGWYPGDKRKLR